MMYSDDSNKRDLVLIIDDSPETLSMLNEVLESSGMDTLVALEGNQALAIARKMIPDIILLDAVMPSMSGFEVCEILKQDPELRSIPVIFMTGLSDNDSVVKGFNVGGIDYITKPIVNTELIARIRVHLANSRVALSAQSALDLAGQYVFAVNQDGETIWSTPQVNHLFETTGNQPLWDNEKLHLEIKEWLVHDPAMGMSIQLQNMNCPLKIFFLGKANTNEFLLRLVNQNMESESSVLKNHWQLTTREAEVLLWIAKGKTNREIGQILGTSPRTINKHSDNIFKKLGVENRTSAAAKTLEQLQK